MVGLRLMILVVGLFVVLHFAYEWQSISQDPTLGSGGTFITRIQDQDPIRTQDGPRTSPSKLSQQTLPTPPDEQ